jgi:glycosyltransferase involved in cell wall biosynthesis
MTDLRVLALTRYARRGASSRLRFEQFVPGLAALGIEVAVAPLLDEAFLARRYAGGRANVLALARAYAFRAARQFRREPWDLIWLEKEAFPWLPDVFERLLTRSDVPIVADFDDAWFHRYDLHDVRLVRAALGTKLDAVMRRAAAVCAGNEYIADRARRAGAPRVELVPTVVDLPRYEASPVSPAGPFTVGWIGTPLTAGYLNAITPALRDVARTRPLRLCAVGAAPFRLEGIDVTTPPWSEDSEAAMIAGFDVGVMPLPDSPWERGKCGYKLIQYMASAKPIIASPVGVNTSLVREGENGFLANDDASWASALRAVYDDPERRASMGAAGRRLVAASYDLRVQLPRLAGILRSAASKPQRAA